MDASKFSMGDREDSMTAPKKMTGEIETRRRAGVFIGNLTALLGLLVIGYPLAPATIRTMLFSWILIVVAIVQFIFGHLQTRQSPVTLGRQPYTRPCERERIAVGGPR
jgi:uncharacterized membrane protein HdeD (DUF308 family)